MILEKNVNDLVKTIERYYKNMELATYSINTNDKCIDIALYDDIRKDNTLGKFFGSNHFRSTEITIPNMTDKQLQRILNKLEKLDIKENEVYDIPLNTPIYNINDVVKYENNDYGKIIDINRNSEYPYGVIFKDIYLEDRPFWASEDEISFANDKEKVKELDNWYIENKDEIEKDINLSEEMECD